MSIDKVTRIYFRLNSLKQNMPDSHNINEKYTKDYHGMVDELEKVLDSSLDEFRIPAEEIKPIMTSGNYLTGERNYSNENFCERALFMSKMDALILYLSSLIKPEDRKIGFSN